MDESPTKKQAFGLQPQEKPFPGQMAENYQSKDIEAIRANAARARSGFSLSQGRALGKTASAPVISSTVSLFTNPQSPGQLGSPTRAPLHSRDASMNELQPYGDLKKPPLDGFDMEEMDFDTPHASPSPSPRKNKRALDEGEDEAVGMEQDSPSPSPRASPTKGLASNRMLGRAVTEPSLRFDESF